MNLLDTIIVIGSLTIVVWIGRLASRGVKETASEYFLASGKMPWYIIGTAFVSTSVSSEQIVGTVGAAYRDGMGVANWEWWGFSTFLLLLTFIPIYLKNRISTVPELLTRRYGPLCADIYSWVMLPAYVFIFLVPVLYGGSLAFSNLAGWNFYLVLWGTVLLVALYTIKGGLKAVMWTDAVQCLMLIGGGILLYCVAIWKIPGGWSAMIQASPERFHLYHPPGDKVAPFLGLIAGSVGLFLFYEGANQVMIQRVLSARSTWDGMMGIVFANCISLFRPLVTCFLGLIVYHWIHVMKEAPPLADPDMAFPFVLTNLSPAWGLRGIVLAGFLAAVMSTISALANSTATMFSLDVYKKLIHRNAADDRVVLVGRIASTVALVLAAIVAPSVRYLGGIFVYFQTGVTYLATPFIAVILMGFFWRRSNYPAALFGLIGGIAIQLAVAFGLPILGYDLHWLYAWNSFIAFANPDSREY